MYKKYREYVQKTLPMRDKLEQLAEEAAELSQAALKVIRAAGVSDNPTPVLVYEAWRNLAEEFGDVVACYSIVAKSKTELETLDASDPKWKRWAERLGYKEDNKQMELPL